MIKKAMIAAGLLTSLAGCASGPSPTGIGLVTDVKGPITATTAQGTKTGTSCAKSIMGFYNDGDASIVAAKRAGGISTVSSVDYHTHGAYPFYGTTCVVVTGE